MSKISVSGILTDEGVEKDCQAMRGLDGKIYTLIGDKGASSAMVYSAVMMKLDICKCNPPTLAISASGMVNSSGWTNPELLPVVYFIPPSDGVYELMFMAKPPTGIALQVFMPISANFFWRDVDLKQVKGVRIRAAHNAVTEMLGGKTIKSAFITKEIKIPDFDAFIGKQFIYSGPPKPGGNGDKFLLEDDLKAKHLIYIVISPKHPITDCRYDHNRLRIYLDDNDVVTALSWG